MLRQLHSTMESRSRTKRLRSSTELTSSTSPTKVVSSRDAFTGSVCVLSANMQMPPYNCIQIYETSRLRRPEIHCLQHPGSATPNVVLHCLQRTRGRTTALFACCARLFCNACRALSGALKYFPAVTIDRSLESGSGNRIPYLHAEI